MRDDHPEQLPLARTDQLIVKEVDDEVLVYDLKTDQAHCLNDTAARIWKNCDGNRSVSEIQVSSANEADAPVDERVVWLALDQLEKFKLIEAMPRAPKSFAAMNRRQMIRNLGVAAVALPLVVSIIAPMPAHALSCVNPGGSAPGALCANNGACCSNNCKTPPSDPGGFPKKCQ